MINELLWFGLLIVSFGMVILSYKLFGKIGLFIWTAIAVILANIQVMKTIEIFGLVTALGNIIYSSLFLVTDILNENHSKNDAKKSVYIGFFVLLSVTLIMQITLYFIPHATDTLSPSIANIFGLLPRIALASLVAYTTSQLHDVWIFAKLKEKFNGKKLWLRNNISTLSSQLLDNVIFTLIAFVGVFEWSIIIQIFVTSLILKFIVAGLDTPFIYLARRIKGKEVFK